VWISTVFKLFGHFLFKGRCYHPLWSWPTYYLMLLDTVLEENTSIQVIKNAPYCALTRPPGTMTLTNLCLYYVCTFMLISALWAHWFLRRSFKYVPFTSTTFPYCGPHPMGPWF
jgi:hypothetical protein